MKSKLGSDLLIIFLLPYSGYFIIGVVAGDFYTRIKSLFKSSTIERNFIIRFSHFAEDTLLQYT